MHDGSKNYTQRLKIKILKYNVEQEVLVSLDHSQLMPREMVQYLCFVVQRFTGVLQIITG